MMQAFFIAIRKGNHFALHFGNANHIICRMTQTVAILTGDLIDSTSAPPEAVEATMEVLADAAARLADDTRFTRYRGDGWQISLSTPGDCLLASLYLLARLQATPGALSTRIAVGIGEARFAGASLSSAMGTAFTISGRGLDRMGRDQTLTLDGEGVDLFQTQCFAFAADLAGRWTREQAEVAALALSDPDLTQEGIARELGITRQAVAARMKAADLRLLTDAASAFQVEYPLRFRGAS